MGRAARASDPELGGYRFGGWQLERGGRSLLQPNGARVSLSKGEYALLLAFLEAPQRPLTRERLLQATRIHEDIFDRSIDVQVLRLRRKLETDPTVPRVIQTERGVCSRRSNPSKSDKNVAPPITSVTELSTPVMFP